MQSVRVIIPALLVEKKRMEELHSCGKTSFDDYITPIENIECDRIVGIRCKFPGCEPLFI